MNTQVKEWCREQCILQHATTEDDFANMEAAWIAAIDGDQTITINTIRGLAELVDPVANPDGEFRKGPAVFMDGGIAADAKAIPDILHGLIRLLTLDSFLITPAEFYNELMYIHPWRDGNGRVGALVYNILNGTIDNPVNPPDYK